MADGYDEESDGKDTQVLAAKDTPPDLEGTVEMDRESLFRRLQADSDSSPQARPDSPRDRASTLKLQSVDTSTMPSKTVQIPAVDHNSTKSFSVPDDVIEKLRRDDLRDYKTLDVPLEAIEPRRSKADHTTLPMQESELVEFASVIDENGRIPVPAAKLVDRFQPGRRVVVVMRIIEE